MVHEDEEEKSEEWDRKTERFQERKGVSIHNFFQFFLLLHLPIHSREISSFTEEKKSFFYLKISPWLCNFYSVIRQLKSTRMKAWRQRVATWRLKIVKSLLGQLSMKGNWISSSYSTVYILKVNLFTIDTNILFITRKKREKKKANLSVAYFLWREKD